MGKWISRKKTPPEYGESPFDKGQYLCIDKSAATKSSKLIAADEGDFDIQDPLSLPANGT